MARVELTREAERFYNHKVKFINPQNVPLWRWDGKELIMESASDRRAEEYHGLRFAQLALDIDSAYPQAQILATSIATDHAIEKAGLDQPLSKSPKLKELLTTINPSVLTAALDRAIDERRTTVALGARSRRPATRRSSSVPGARRSHGSPRPRTSTRSWSISRCPITTCGLCCRCSGRTSMWHNCRCSSRCRPWPSATGRPIP
jgi:hypothetical protein